MTPSRNRGCFFVIQKVNAYTLNSSYFKKRDVMIDMNKNNKNENRLLLVAKVLLSDRYIG